MARTGGIHTLVLLGLLLAVAYIYFPSFFVTYLWDDCDILHSLVQSSNGTELLRWFLRFHNEHFIPCVKLVYFLCYTNFWLNPIPFHLVIIGALFSIMVILNNLVFQLLDDRNAALIASGIFGLSTAYFPCAQSLSQSHILFCLLFMLIMLYAPYRYAMTRRRGWQWIAFISGLAAPATFALGLASGIWLLVFYFLCIPVRERDTPQKTAGILVPPLSGWLLTTAWYISSINQAIYAGHYSQVGRTSAFDACDLGGGVMLTLKTVAFHLIPNLFAIKTVSLLLFGLAGLSLVMHWRRIMKRPIFFFALWTLANYCIIYTFRAPWADIAVSRYRYSVFSVLGIAACYAFCFHPAVAWLKRLPVIGARSALAGAVLIISLAVWSSALFIRTATAPTMLWYEFCKEFREAITDYVRDKGPGSAVRIKNRPIMPRAESDIAIYPEPKPLEFYASFILPRDLRAKITWGDETDPAFLGFIATRRDRYPVVVLKLLP